MSWKAAQERNRRLIKLHNLTKNCYGRGVGLDDNGTYKRYYISGHGKKNNYVKWAKNQSRRKFRRFDIDYPINNKGHFKRVYDLMWEIY